MSRLPFLAIVCFFCLITLGPARDHADEFKTSSGVVKITPVTHGSLVVELAGRTIYVDPWGRGDFSGFAPADLILITDIHGDHLDKNAIDSVKKADTKIIAPRAVADKVPEYSAEVLANGEQTTLGQLTIEAVPMYCVATQIRWTRKA